LLVRGCDCVWPGRVSVIYHFLIAPCYIARSSLSCFRAAHGQRGSTGIAQLALCLYAKGCPFTPHADLGSRGQCQPTPRVGRFPVVRGIALDVLIDAGGESMEGLLHILRREARGLHKLKAALVGPLLPFLPCHLPQRLPALFPSFVADDDPRHRSDPLNHLCTTSGDLCELVEEIERRSSIDIVYQHDTTGVGTRGPYSGEVSGTHQRVACGQVEGGMARRHRRRCRTSRSRTGY
jgi:hypothetical protein